MRFNWNGKRRWVALILLLAGFFVMLNVPPVIPVIQLPGEVYPEGWEILGLRLTNTFVGSVIVWILLVIFAFYIYRRRPKSGNEVPRGGFYNLFEMVFEGLYNFVGNIAGEKHFNMIFGIFMTIFLIVLPSNWLELVPGIDSVGFIHEHVKEKYDEETGKIKLVPTDGFETYQGFLGSHSVNGDCPWISPEAFEEANLVAIELADGAAILAAAEIQEALATADFRGEDASDLPTPEEAAEDARQEVLDAREAEIQARRDNGCVTGTPEGYASLADHGEESADAEHSDEGEATADAEGEDAQAETAEGEDDQSDDEEVAAAAGAEDDHGDSDDQGGGHHFEVGDFSVPWVVLPFVRVPSTDLNMTLALALIAVAMTQYAGFKELGLGYLGKFFAFGNLFKSPLGAIDVIVGLLELIGEFARILSFSFRLLGNIFAGSILLFVMSFLIPFLPWPFFILEFFVGIIQALVFALLTAIFMNLATQGHGHDEEHEGEHA